MWPWEQAPRSLAHGILDDETYDWFGVVKGLCDSGGSPVVVSEQELARAYALAGSRDGVRVDHTGTAGLAGLAQLVHCGRIAPDERVGIIYSGAERA